MKFNKVTLAAAAVAAASAPIAGQAFAAERTSAPVSGESEMGGNAVWFVLFAAAVIVGIVVTGDETPASP